MFNPWKECAHAPRFKYKREPKIVIGTEPRAVAHALVVLGRAGAGVLTTFKKLS